jgi:Ion channel
MTATAVHTVEERAPQHRYVLVLVLTLVLLVFEVIAPDTNWAHAIVLALAAAALMVAVATSRERRTVRRLRAVIVGAVATVVVIGIGTGVLSVGVTAAVVTVTVALIPATLIGGLVRLIREHGVTVQAVAGALAIYLLVGLLFASLISFVARVEHGDYFAQPGPVDSGVRVYYSFTTLTTTGFGDYTPAHPVGHALAVLEMLTGQLYLVTVIGILVGNFAGRRVGRDHPNGVMTGPGPEE